MDRMGTKYGCVVPVGGEDRAEIVRAPASSTCKHIGVTSERIASR